MVCCQLGQLNAPVDQERIIANEEGVGSLANKRSECGVDLSDGADVEKGDCLIWSGEDGLGDTLVPRFLATGGDPQHLHFVNDVIERGQPRPFDPALDMPKLEAACRALPALRLIVLDPVVAAAVVPRAQVETEEETAAAAAPAAEAAAAPAEGAPAEKKEAGKDDKKKAGGKDDKKK